MSATWAWVAVGGAVGAVSRYAVSLAVGARVAGSLPYGTLVVNVTGSLLLGFLAGLALARPDLDPRLTLLLGTGFCGGYTTFSTFAAETVALAGQRPVLAVVNVAVSNTLAILAALAGVALGRR